MRTAVETPPAVALIQLLREAIDSLRDDVHLTPHGAAPTGWQTHPVILALGSLPALQRAATISVLLRDDEVLLQIVGMHLLILGQHSALLPQAIASSDARDDALLNTMVLAAIGRLRAFEHVEKLHAALKDPQLFWVSVESLTIIGDERAQGALRRAIAACEDKWDRLDIVTVLGEVGGEISIQLLIEVLQDPKETFEPIHGFAAQALGAQGDPRAITPLIDALTDPRIKEKGRVLWGIAALETPLAFDAVAPFVEAADKPWWRAEALRALAMSDSERAWPRVQQAAKSAGFFREDLEAFIKTVQALGCCRKAESLDMLLDVLRFTQGRPPCGAIDWTVPDVARGGGIQLTGTTLRALEAQLELSLMPEKRPEHFTPSTLIQHLIETLADHLHAIGHPRAEALALSSP